MAGAFPYDSFIRDTFPKEGETAESKDQGSRDCFGAFSFCRVLLARLVAGPGVPAQEKGSPGPERRPPSFAGVRRRNGGRAGGGAKGARAGRPQVRSPLFSSFLERPLLRSHTSPRSCVSRAERIATNEDFSSCPSASQARIRSELLPAHESNRSLVLLGVGRKRLSPKRKPAVSVEAAFGENREPAEPRVSPHSLGGAPPVLHDAHLGHEDGEKYT